MSNLKEYKITYRKKSDTSKFTPIAKELYSKIIKSKNQQQARIDFARENPFFTIVKVNSITKPKISRNINNEFLFSKTDVVGDVDFSEKVIQDNIILNDNIEKLNIGICIGETNTKDFFYNLKINNTAVKNSENAFAKKTFIYLDNNIIKKTNEREIDDVTIKNNVEQITQENVQNIVEQIKELKTYFPNNIFILPYRKHNYLISQQVLEITNEYDVEEINDSIKEYREKQQQAILCTISKKIIKYIQGGSIEQLKEVAIDLLKKEKNNNKYYIVTNKRIFCAKNFFTEVTAKYNGDLNTKQEYVFFY
jgi:hypothetical protein